MSSGVIVERFGALPLLAHLRRRHDLVMLTTDRDLPFMARQVDLQDRAP